MHCFCIYLNFIHHGNQSRFARLVGQEYGTWNAATLGEYLEFLGSELRAKRMKHGLDASSKALILMDKAIYFEKLRDRFQRAHNDFSFCRR